MPFLSAFRETAYFCLLRDLLTFCSLQTAKHPPDRNFRIRRRRFLSAEQAGESANTRMKCNICKAEALVKLRAHNAAFCRDCFLQFFSRQVAKGIEKEHLCTREDRILVAVSGGKDSLSLLYELIHQGYDATGLFIDLGIPVSSQAARRTVEEFCTKHGLRLIVKELAEDGLDIPTVKAAIRRPICSVCGKLKRHYFNRIAMEEGFTVLATGHNLDDEVARLFSNTLRWDLSYLASDGPLLPAHGRFVRKIKPLWRLTEFETANYAFLTEIEPHIAPCPYSPGASFTTLKGVLQRLEYAMPGRKLDFYQGFIHRGRKGFEHLAQESGDPLHDCPECGYPTSGEDICGVCRIRHQVAAFREAQCSAS